MSYLSVIIPFYNEEKNLAPLIERLSRVLVSLNKPFEVIFIDDGSSDNGFNILKGLLENKENWKIVRFKRNFGQTPALAAGIETAKGEKIILMDADLENDPQDIPMLLSELDKGYDVVSGWRKKRWSDKILTRRLTSQTANWLISKISGLCLHDYACTLKAYQSDTIKNINLYGQMHRFIPALAFWQGARVKEIEVHFQPRQFGQSKYGLNRMSRVLLDLVTLKFLSGYATKPIYFFGRIGLISLLFGFLTFLWAFYYKITGQKDFVETPLPIVIVLFVFLAVLLVLIGLLAEMIMRTYHESGNKKIYSVKERVNF